MATKPNPFDEVEQNDLFAEAEGLFDKATTSFEKITDYKDRLILAKFVSFESKVDTAFGDADRVTAEAAGRRGRPAGAGRDPDLPEGHRGPVMRAAPRRRRPVAEALGQEGHEPGLGARQRRGHPRAGEAGRGLRPGQHRRLGLTLLEEIPAPVALQAGGAGPWRMSMEKLFTQGPQMRLIAAHELKAIHKIVNYLDN